MTFEDYDKLHIHCSVHFSDFGFPGMWWKYSVDWYNKEGKLVKGNVGSAYSRAEANEKVLAVAKDILERGYSNEPMVVAFDRTNYKYAAGTVWQP